MFRNPVDKRIELIQVLASMCIFKRTLSVTKPCFLLVVGMTACIGINDLAEDPFDVLPEIPQKLVARAGDAHVTVSWRPVAGAKNYNLYWTDDNSPASKQSPNKITLSAERTFFGHTGLLNETTYRYVVTGMNDVGESAESNEATAIPKPVLYVGTTDIDFTLCCATCCFDNAIGYALWVEDSFGIYVDTIVYYFYHSDAPGYGNAALPHWVDAADSIVDGISEASKFNGDSVSYTWNGQDRYGNEMQQGAYTFYLEITDWSMGSELTSTTMDLQEIEVNDTATNHYVQGVINYGYSP